MDGDCPLRARAGEQIGLLTRRQSGATVQRRWRQRLLAWYDRSARDLPWRQDRDPYRVWLSEIMLQQTRVAAVLEHYRVFLQRFPTVQKLAAARESSVLAAWSGLGYYRRARMLHAAAKTIVNQRQGQFPDSVAELRKPARHRTLYGSRNCQHRFQYPGGGGGRKCRAGFGAGIQSRRRQKKITGPLRKPC